MSDTDNPANDEEQLATVPTDYRALLAMTCPLVVEEHTLPSWRGGEIFRSGFGIPLMPANCRVESTLRRGEIVRLDKSGLGTTGDEGRATGNKEAGTSWAAEVEDKPTQARSGLPQTDSNLRIRIYLGMS
jgi:hypothetical protein